MNFMRLREMKYLHKDISKMCEHSKKELRRLRDQNIHIFTYFKPGWSGFKGAIFSDLGKNGKH